MRLLELSRRRPLAAACACGLLLGSAIGAFLPIRAPVAPKPEQVAWALPDAKNLKRMRDDQFQAMRSARFWGELAMPGRRSQAQSASWNLVAIVTRPQLQVAVTPNGKPQPTWVRVGGQLPDGAMLVAANRDRIWFEKDGCKRTRQLYQDKTKPEPDGCIGQPASGGAAAPVGSETRIARAPESRPAATLPNSKANDDSRHE